ncbi:hypothetical protein BGX38DRAFT_1278768 [Terfezia claveryi]|nr:hypothetical protein BGX38DRAFT_1278768 [Terfezia claveryi]
MGGTGGGELASWQEESWWGKLVVREGLVARVKASGGETGGGWWWLAGGESWQGAGSGGWQQGEGLAGWEGWQGASSGSWQQELAARAGSGGWC